ncbi:TPA: RelA/SpoT domain-containing protein, partial [Methanosarcina acetivorans]
MQKQMSNLIEEYKQARPEYEEYTKKIYELICNLIKESSIKTYSVDKRTKGIENLEEKLCRKGNAYNQLSDITDLSGVRVVCYFSSEVEHIAKIIEQNFMIIPELSIDKKKLLDPDRFGYLSLHYVVKLSETRKNLLEYRKCQDLLCEIQIRSILQHSWAEIEHDLVPIRKV